MNNPTLDQNGIINGTKNELDGTECDDTGNKKKWIRNCPNCHREIIYSFKNCFVYAIKNTKYCSKCYPRKRDTTEDFIRKSHIVHGNTYNYDKITYDKSNKKVEIICSIHGSFFMTPHAHLRSHGCPKCRYIKSAKSKTFTEEKYINKAKLIHGNLYDYSKTIYKRNDEKVEMICKRHGVFQQSPHNHLKGNGCPKCKMSRGEAEITKWLNNNNIEYIYQKVFDDFIKLKYGVFKFDFYIPSKNTIIEYDGEQHFLSGRHMNGQYITTEDDLKHTQENDQIKNEYAKSKGIDVIRISYKQKNDVDKILREELHEKSL